MPKIKDYIKDLHAGLELADSARISLEASLRISARPTQSEVQEIAEAETFANLLTTRLANVAQEMRKVELKEVKE